MRMSPLQHVLEVIGVTALILLIVFVSNNQTTSAGSNGISCAGGVTPTLATQAEAQASNGTITAGVTYVCPNDTTVGTTDSAAKADLLKNFNHTGTTQGITSLNSAFAIQLDKLLNAANQSSVCKGITINSGFRSTAQQAQIMAAHPGTYTGTNPSSSLHTQGLAADLQYPDAAGTSKSTCDSGASGSACYQWMKNNDQQYGINLYNQAGYRNSSTLTGECNHVQAASATGGSTPGGTTGTGTAAPTNGMMSSPESYLQGTGSPNVTQQCVAGFVAYNGSCYQVQSSGQNCTLGTINVGGACVPMSMLQSLLSPQTTSAPPPPAPVSTPATAPTTASTLSAAPSLSTTATTPTTQTSTLGSTITNSSTSAENLLEALENPPQLVIPTLATASPIDINENGISQLAPTNPPSNLEPSVEPLAQVSAPTQNGASLGQVTTEQPGTNESTQVGSTFTSGNLGTGATSQPSGILATFGQRTASAALSILQTLQGELINALQFLKPFSGSAQ